MKVLAAREQDLAARMEVLAAWISRSWASLVLVKLMEPSVNPRAAAL